MDISKKKLYQYALADMVLHIPKKDLEQAVRIFCPIFYLCRDDSFAHPSSFGYFIQQSRLVCLHPKCNRVLKNVGHLTPECLREAQCESCGAGEQLTLELVSPEARFGERDCKIDDIPVYAHVKGVLGSSAESYEALEITYITLFAHNGPYAVCPFLDVGAHDGDIEHITVRVDPTGSKLMGVWYNSHRNHDGSWVPGSEVEIESGRLVSYVAKHGHGHYPKATTTYRHFFLANDVTKKDIRWSPKNVILLPTYDIVDDDVHLHHRSASKGKSIVQDECLHGSSDADMYPLLVNTDPCHWMYFKGFFGTAPAPIAQRWFHEAEPPLSRHPLLRVFLHFWPETVSL